MGCGSCGSTAGGQPKGCGNNGSCGTGGCNKLNTYDWLKDMALPSDYQPFDVVEIRFKGSRKEFFRNAEGLDIYTGDCVVVESDIGHDIGHVSLSGELVRLQMKKRGLDESQDLRKIYRLASERDVSIYNDMKAREPESLENARTIAMQMGLEMKLSDIEFQGDGRKVIFFYTAESRVDFRELIKRYATEFRTRIEMRQVSYREEASRLGGIGSCGRELCCSTWLTDYRVVTIGAAKSQNLSINMLKLSGQCGRLKCCLNYELDTYVEALQEFPRQDSLVLETEVGNARPIKIDILKRTMWFTYPKSPEWVPIQLDRVNEIVEMNKKGKKPETLVDKALAAEMMSHMIPVQGDLVEDQELTRLDEKDRQRKERNKRKKFSKGRGKGQHGANKGQDSRPPQNKGNQPDRRGPSKRRPNNRGGYKKGGPGNDRPE